MTPSGLPSYAVDYVNKYSAMAVIEMQRTGIPASITLAQGMLESDYGRSYLARKANNHFGIKCHSTWQGERAYKDDDRKNECFRSYSNVKDSYKDHSDFLVTGSRYKDLFRLSSTDYKGWAHGLKKAGYATDPDYASLLIRKIDEYGLHAFDAGIKKSEQKEITAPAEVKPQAVESQPAASLKPAEVISLGTGRTGVNNEVKYVVVREGDTFSSLAAEFQLLAWELSRFNDLPSGTALQPGQIIFLEPKRTKAAEGNSIHLVRSGETMHLISQQYAIKLNSLYKMNLMDKGKECTAGQKVRIR
ncbi:MAG: glucosaminidase domain-containing protein [Bacteroidales bacterium]|nr:glucosaminidase domain-containing protein [Bacteroidales bacterium]